MGLMVVFGVRQTNDYNFGHTLPLLEIQGGLTSNDLSSIIITDAAAEGMRTERVFLSSESILNLSPSVQFTVEPQCVSQRSSEVPKVMMHYVVQHVDGKFQVCDACDDLPSKYDLN